MMMRASLDFFHSEWPDLCSAVGTTIGRLWFSVTVAVYTLHAFLSSAEIFKVNLFKNLY